MTIQKLPDDFQTSVCPINKICDYKRAIEELVYNSLDAEATSIAIRISIEESMIQVIDNGFGVSKNDFTLLGQKYATSKCVDLSTLKSAPNKYGFHGQSLASIIEVSQCVKITSRHNNSDEAWMKSFHNGKEQNILVNKPRASRGTTVDIKGFLYNMNIRKKIINPFCEIDEIKQFLEQLTLVHNNISLSLRDDDKNEIVLKIHKNRDIYQTLSSMYGIERADLQELIVEKNQYKVTAYIGKRDKDINQKHWIFLNGKILETGKLHKLIDENLSKSLGLKHQRNKKEKNKNGFNGEDNVTHKGKIPFYLVFLSCPYHDYDLSYTPKQSTLEFKNWDQITKLLEKLVKFYVGDVNLKETKQSVLKQTTHGEKDTAIRDQVKKIMDKILRSNSKRPGVSQMQNGVKGKLAKRKFKKKTPKIHLSKVIPSKIKTPTVQANVNDEKINDSEVIQQVDNFSGCVGSGIPAISAPYIDTSKNKHKNIAKFKTTKTKTGKRKLTTKKKPCSRQLNENLNDEKEKTENNNQISPKKTNRTTKSKVLSKQQKHSQKKKCEKKYGKKDLIGRFAKETGSIKKRCNMLSEKVEDLLSYKKKRKQQIFINEEIQFSSVTKDNKNVSIRKKVGEIVIHDYVPIPPQYRPCSFDNRVWNNPKNKPCKSSYDLIQTILKSQQTVSHFTETNTLDIVPSELLSPSPVSNTSYANNINYSPNPQIQRFTYDSHYNSRIHWNGQGTNKNNTKKRHFITNQSKDNFILPCDKQNTKTKTYKTHFRNRNDFRNKKPYLKNKFTIDFYHREDFQQQSVTIDFSSETNAEDFNRILGKKCEQQKYFANDKQYSTHNFTYTIESQHTNIDNKNVHCDNLDTDLNDINYKSNGCSKENSDIFRTYEMPVHANNTGTVENKSGTEKINIENLHDIEDATSKINVLFISDTQEKLTKKTSEENINPMEVCEIVLTDNRDIDIADRSVSINNDTFFKDDFLLKSCLLDRDALACSHSDEENNNRVDQNDCKAIYAQVNTRPSNIRDTEKSIEDKCCKNMDEDNFNFRNRLRFLPKGMSQIFENCQTKYSCEYNDTDQEYFKKNLYENFINNVQENYEILQPCVQDVKELTTKEVHKAGTRIDKDSASLIFNGDSLKQATILGQVDEKFIAAKIQGRCYQSLDISNYLVLFDQHAVHERIRLEKNLTDYLIGDQWKSTSLDGFTLKLAKEDLLYLHNYRDKFVQFGLNWTVLNEEEVSVDAIPEAVLGKNARQVEVIMKAVKDLIHEEINAIKSQKGCVSLYPKSIMDLVFSEACRYAIKFGDRISKNDCVELLNQLSNCKTPFQCAHGRPVMAVVMEITQKHCSYNIDMKNLKKFKSKKNRYIRNCQVKV